MIFVYGEQLPQEEIVEAATDQELIRAFAQIMRADLLIFTNCR